MCSLGVTMASFKGSGSSSAGLESFGSVASEHATVGPSVGRVLTKEELERAARSRELALAKRAEAKRKQGASAAGTGSGGGWVTVKKAAPVAEETAPQTVTCSRRSASVHNIDLPAVLQQEVSPLDVYNDAAAGSRASQSAEGEWGPALSKMKKGGGPTKEEDFLFVLGSENKSMAVSHVASDSLAESAPRRPAAPAQPVEAQLSEQQMAVLKAVGEGKSVFLTGSAGTGKSFLLAYAIRLLRYVRSSPPFHPGVPLLLHLL